MAVRILLFALTVLMVASGSNARIQKETFKFENVLHLKQQMDGGFLKDDDGFLWIGTTGGLFRYDGIELKNYKAGSDSLSGNWIRAIVQDHDGFIWIGTYTNGVTRYDKQTHTFTHYKHDPENLQSLSHNSIPYEVQSMLVDRAGVLWVATQGGGLNRYDKGKDAFTAFRHDPENRNSLSSNRVTALMEDRNGLLWIGTEDAGLNRLDPRSGTWTHYRRHPGKSVGLSDKYVKSLLEDRDGTLWVGTKTGGLNRFDRKGNMWRQYLHRPDDPDSIGGNEISFIHEDLTGRIWICHDLPDIDVSGVDTFDKETEQFVRHSHEPDNPHSPSSNSVSRIYEDPETGIIWVINNISAVDKIDPQASKFTIWQHDPQNQSSLSANGTSSIYQDSRGDIWVGGLGGLDRLDKATGTFKHHVSDTNDPKKLPYKWIVAMLEDTDGNFWMVSKNVLTLFDRDTGKVIDRYAHRPGDPHSITRSNAVRSLIQDRDDPDVLWLGTHGGGVDRFDKRRKIFSHFKHDPADPTSLSEDVMRVILDDGRGSLWIPTFNGLNRMDKKSGTFIRYYHNPDDSRSISSNFLLEVFQDRSDNIWIVGKGGLSRFDSATGGFDNFSGAEGFPATTLSSILEDGAGQFWIGTVAYGLIKFNPQTGQIRQYTESDGLQSDTFWGGSRFKTKDGRLWFGGGNGLNSFFPEAITDNPHIPPIVLTSLKQGGNVIDLGTAPEKVRQLHLDWQSNFFEFKFAALNHTRPEQNQYAYMLEGVDKQWYHAGHNPFGRYSNLPGGSYTLRLKGANNDGLWNEEGISIQVTVVPPIWRQGWFQLAMGLILFVGIFLAVVLRFKAAVARGRELERLVTERTHDLELAKETAEVASRAKSRFLANMSHELRTPLNSVLGYAQILKRHIGFTGPMLNGLNIIQQSGNHLLTLINDVLDMAKIEADRMDLTPAPFQLNPFLQEIIGIIDARAEARSLVLTYEALSPLPEQVVADERRLRQVLLNLLGNAVKFTTQGYVALTANAMGDSANGSGERLVKLRFSVEDTGIGMDGSRLEQIFQPFERLHLNEFYFEGTGLGLPISQQIVEMMGSRIEVKSRLGRGSTFWFDLELPTTEMVEQQAVDALQNVVGYKGDRRKILVVDDRPYNRLLLREFLSSIGFEIFEAEDGRQGVDKALAVLPDLIIMDLVMPVMTGIEATMEIRTFPELKKTMVLAVSASPFNQQKDESQVVGCDAYLSKPIKMEDLLDFLESRLDLDWIYAKEDPEHPENVKQSLITPSPEELSAIFKLAKQGRVVDVQRKAALLAEQDEKLVPFTDELVDLAKGFEMEKIVTWIERLSKEK
jgi:signal transduction histidine kinase/ligand-binding sensor domain-containing protein/DNA-binding NarL/FixJ family response regulator